MMLFVACTGPPFTGGTIVADELKEDTEADDDDVKAVEPESCEEREFWLLMVLMVWLNPGRPFAVPLVWNTGAVFVRARVWA